MIERVWKVMKGKCIRKLLS
ncbi:hypothetical protein CN271_16535 [Bacillus cereus]|nr:hypothetical protein CON59_23475 [Bacillus cereus]PET48075.1 hypothetical protein CN523_10550 [Bacillus cereus]PEV79954.1 hypothetical protein CN429_17290 [Bacillus cereus]PFA55718.1 hypothetical protein CN389_14990 [Bacillus cereus]PFD70913.1 hypothetical protein CN271_16535 [Bacillus cereus]